MEKNRSMSEQIELPKWRAYGMGRINPNIRRMSLAPNIMMATGLQEEEHEEQGKFRTFWANHFKTVVTLIMIMGTVAVIVLIVMVHTWRFKSEQAEAAKTCLDVAIVGAGISGSYAAWKLRYSGLKVHVYDMNSRIGGRFYTHHLNDVPDLNAELGAMYYLPQKHPLLNQTILALTLDPIKFPQQSHAHSMFYLRGSLLRHSDLMTDNELYHLEKEEKGKSPEQLRKIYNSKATLNETTNSLKIRTTDGFYLYKYGYMNMLGRVASKEGYNFLHDTATWRSLLSNENAAMLSQSYTEDEAQMTLKEGMDIIPKKLMEQFLNVSDKHQLHLNRRLACIKKVHKLYQLTFVETIQQGDDLVDYWGVYKILAKKIILALPKDALKDVDFKPFNESPRTRRNIDSVTSVPGIRIYFVYDKHWWKSHRPMKIITDLPLHETFFIGKQKSVNEEKYLFLVANVDGEETNYFKALIENSFQGRDIINMQCNKTHDLVTDITNQLAKMYKMNKSDIPLPCSMLIHDWGNTPSKSAWHIWKRGIKWDDIAHQMLKPKRREEVYVVGSSFSAGEQQLWAEGALQTVENLISNYFNETDLEAALKFPTLLKGNDTKNKSDDFPGVYVVKSSLDGQD